MKKYLAMGCSSLCVLFVALAFSLSVQAAAPACGLTIITHGFEKPVVDGFPSWATDMAVAITNRIGAALPIYRVKYHLLTPVTIEDRPSGTDIDLSLTGGAIILLDWSEISGVTTVPAQDVADSFIAYLFGQTHNGHSLAEIPIHLIGHSRGCSLNARLAYILAESGVLVDQVTTLDPHPCLPWQIPFEGDDLIPATYINVLFADNYWQSHLLSFPDGMSIAGAFDQDLSSVLTGLDWTPHTHVHTYYHGTIDLSASSVDGDSIVSAWYQNTLSRDETGYNFSRFTNPLLPRPSSGINQFISGAGGTGSRVSTDLSSTLWPNAGFDQRSSLPSAVTVGQAISIPYYYADWAYHETITFSLDGDANSFNGIEHDIGSINQNIISAGTIGTALFPWTPTASDVGTHYIRIQATDSGGRTRYDYYLKPIIVQPAAIPTPTITSVSPATLPPSSSPQAMTIYGSNFLPPSDANASKLIFYDPANNPTPLRTPSSYVNSGQLNYNATLPVTGTWKVKVENGSAESLPYSFTVASGTAQLTGLSISGPATVNENSSGQFTAKAIFRVLLELPGRFSLDGLRGAERRQSF